MVATTYFERALATTRKAFVAARDVANAVENVGLHMQFRGSRRQIEGQIRRAQTRLLDLRLLVSDLEAHLRLSDAAEEKATPQRKRKDISEHQS